METFKPNRGLGLACGLALVLLILALDGAMIWRVTQTGISVVGFLMLLVVLCSLFALALLTYWLHGLLSSSYNMDRNALVIRWGATTQVIPMESISAVLSGDQIPDTLHFRGPVWPGLRVGYGELEETGPTLFFATGSSGKQVVLVTPVLAYALSPADPTAFLTTLRQRMSMGPTQSIDQMSRQPAFLSWSFWNDHLGIALLASGLFLLLALFGFIWWRYPYLADLQPLHFDAIGQPDRWGTRAQMFTLPFIGMLALIANGGLGFLLYERERPASYLLWSGSIGVQILVWVATLGILR